MRGAVQHCGAYVYDDYKWAPTRLSPLFEPTIISQAMVDACRKLDPRHQVKNPVMFVVWVGSVLTTLLFLQALVGTGEAPACSFSPSRCGSGSPCCLPTSRKPWRKDGAKRRPTRSGERVGNSPPRSSARSSPAASTMPSGIGSSTGRDTFSVVSANQLKKGDVSSWRQAISSPPTARSSKGWRP